MKIDLPSWTYPVHLLVPLLFIAKEQIFDAEPPSLNDWDHKKWTRLSIKALALGTLVSTAIAAGSPSLRSVLKPTPAFLTEGVIIVSHIFASTLGLCLYQLFKKQ